MELDEVGDCRVVRNNTDQVIFVGFDTIGWDPICIATLDGVEWDD